MPRSRSRYVPRPRSPTNQEARTSHEGPLGIAGQSPQSNPLRSMSRAPRSRLKAEVIITTSPLRAKTSSRESSPETPLSLKARTRQSSHATEGAIPSLARGKGKLAHCPSTPEPPLVPSVSRKEHPQVRSDSEDTSQPSPPRGRKRRRVSSSEDEDESPEKMRSASTPPRSMARRRRFKEPKQRCGYQSDNAPTTSSPVSSAHEDEEAPPYTARSASRARSEAPIPALPLYPPMFPAFPPPQHSHHAASDPGYDARSSHPAHSAYTQMSMQYSRAMAWTSYMMATGAWPPPPSLPSASASSFHPSLPFPFYGGPGPRTPSQQAHLPRCSFDYNTPTSEAGPSRPSTYSTPTHYPPILPYGFHPAYSSGTLPPSSPLPSSPINSSPILRPASVPPGQRSRARGRRVSFKLDANDRPLSPTPPRHSRDAEDGPDSGRESEDEPPRTHATKQGRREKTPFKASERKGKGKARTVSLSEESDEDEDGQESSERAGPDRPPRARTPGPPSRREQSVSRGSATSSSKDKGAGKRK
ncbi:hypothetical protein GY45DRAFT_1239751 [Cubamyces sp. BRFM 1775]|nr:hypothetical protein GY45DRAFT_1239751 [Cubamyces sp. BRFM 1775]